MGLAARHDLKGFIVVVAACLAFRHGELLFERLPVGERPPVAGTIMFPEWVAVCALAHIRYARDSPITVKALPVQGAICSCPWSSSRKWAKRPSFMLPSSLTMMICCRPSIRAGLTPSACSKPCRVGTVTLRGDSPG